MIYQYTVNEAKKRLQELIDAALRGETIRIVRDDQVGVELVPLISRKTPRQFGSARGQIIMAPDFDAPLDNFDEYIRP